MLQAHSKLRQAQVGAYNRAFTIIVALVGEGKGPGCGFKFAGSRTRSALKTIR